MPTPNCKIQLLLITISFYLFLHSVAAQVKINEFVASNTAGIQDEINDDTGDWIELYNSGNEAIDLSGYSLTDNLSDTLKWVVPDNTIIEANGFLLFWADGIDQALHTNFKLTREGEEIGLYSDEGELLDGISYPAQLADVSYGRTTDGADSWSWFTTPTPASSNNASQAYEGVVYFQPQLSQRGGFFNAPISLELSSLGGSIRYSTDGSAPDENDLLYNDPIAISTTTVVRARVFSDNKIPGPVVTHSYFFNEDFETRQLPVISLSTDPEFFWDDEIGLYVQDFKPDWEHPINIEFFENDESNRAAFNERAGVKVNGENSWELPQKMLGIYFRNRYGAGKLDYPVFHDRDRWIFDDSNCPNKKFPFGEGKSLTVIS